MKEENSGKDGFVMTIAELTAKMIDFSEGNLHDINHLMKVWAYAKTIGELEGLDAGTQFVLEASAIVHDIACPLCREKYGSTAGPYQEKEGAVLAKTFLSDTDIPAHQQERIIYLVAHHHTLSEISGMDYQILIEADYIVNAGESAYPPENIKGFGEKFFRTPSGISILKSVYGDF